LELGYSFPYLVDFVREFQDVRGIPRSHVIGHSMGGWIAPLLAYESPHRIEKLVLVASGGLAPRPLPSMAGWTAPSEEQFRKSLAKIKNDGLDIEPMVQKRLAWAGDPERVRRFGEIMIHMTNPETRQRYNTARRLTHIQSPTLILWGSEDTVDPFDLGETTPRLIPAYPLLGPWHGNDHREVDRSDLPRLLEIAARAFTAPRPDHCVPLVGRLAGGSAIRSSFGHLWSTETWWQSPVRGACPLVC
jgi:pimeloyl-ACP methyl ester carboxylesterase